MRKLVLQKLSTRISDINDRMMKYHEPKLIFYVYIYLSNAIWLFIKYIVTFNKSL